MKKLLALLLSLTFVFAVAACDTTDDNDEPWFINNEIVGIDPGAGIMEATNTAIDEYGLDMTLEASSGPIMVTELSQAIANEEWIVVTGWEPHYKFADYDLKFLEDPKGIFGDVEQIHTVARNGVHDDFPELVEFFENFFFDSETLGSLMGAMNEGEGDNIDIARDWMADNDLYLDWLPEGYENVGDGETVAIDYVNWAEGIAMTYFAAAILEDYMGYDVELTMADPGIVFSAIAQGDADFFLDAWLPVTHQSFMETYGDDIEDLGLNFDGARIGLVVPAYVDIDSIEDLVRD